MGTIKLTKRKKKKRKVTLKSVLIICSSLLMAGCVNLSGKSSISWTLPPEPQTDSINFKSQDGGYFLTELEAVKLADNIDEIKAYNEKLEVLIREMVKYYK
jgi:hypothetical protein